MARALAVLLLACSALLLTAVACNDEGDFLLEEDRPEATGTPPFLQRTPQPSPAPSPVGSPPAANATPVTPFEITAVGTAANLRESPSTQGGQATVVGTLDPGNKKKVIAEIRGEPLEADNDIWYQLEDGSFVWSGAVEEAP